MLVASVVAAVLVVAAAWLYLTGSRRGAPTAAVPASRVSRPEEASTPAIATLLLEDNVWSTCGLDGHDEDWARFTASPVRGFGGVPCGRHRVVTRCESGAALLDLVIYPGEVLAWRLDAELARWAPVAADGSVSPDALVVHRTVLGVARALRGDAVVDPEAVVGRAAAALAVLLARARSAAPVAAVEADAAAADDALREAAEELGAPLVAVPLTRAQLSALTGPVEALADELASAGAWAESARVASLGLAVLPGAPPLLVALAHARLGVGGEEARRDARMHLDAALARGSALDPRARDRARATQARLGAMGPPTRP